jgi:hypothetical protein
VFPCGASGWALIDSRQHTARCLPGFGATVAGAQVHVACREVAVAAVARGDDKMRPMLLLRACLACFVGLALLMCGPAWAQGTVVAIGGALQDGNGAVWQRLVQLVQRGAAAGSDDDRACFSVITLASAEADASAARVIANLARHGGRGVHLAKPTEDTAAIERCRGIYMTGGAQARLLDTLQGTPAPAPR